MSEETETSDDLPPYRALNCTEISMGHGLVDVGPIYFADRKGLLLRPRSFALPMGGLGELQNTAYEPVPGDVVIWIDDPKGADVIAQEIANFTTAGSVGEQAELDRRAAEAIANQIHALTGAKSVTVTEMDLSQDGELTPVKEEGE